MKETSITVYDECSPPTGKTISPVSYDFILRHSASNARDFAALDGFLECEEKKLILWELED